MFTTTLAHPVELIAAMSTKKRSAMREDFEGKGLISREEFQDYLFNDGPDPLLLAKGRLLAVSEPRKRSESANSQTPEDQALPPGTIQACRARRARIVLD